MGRLYDFIIIGAGVVGLSIARDLSRKFPKKRILVLEKEKTLGTHASGRNSGVLHAGLYYSPGSLKAKLCVRGAQLLRDYICDKKLPFRDCGKIILPTKVEDDSQIDLLIKRGNENGAKLKLINQSEIRELEPMARSLTERGIYSPQTAIFDPKAVLNKIADELTQRHVRISLSSPVQQIFASESRLESGNESIKYGHLINAAGTFSDIIARKFGVAKNLCTLPFKGVYLKLKSPLPFKLNGLIYPVPDLRVPFLGVHITPNTSGGFTLGPSAFPALGREHYGLLEGIEWNELPRRSLILMRQYMSGKQGFRHYAHRELLNLWSRHLVNEGQSMVPALRLEHLDGHAKTGIRAQLFDIDKTELEMDFLIKKETNSTHVLNAVSPGFTSAFSFADYLVENFI